MAAAFEVVDSGDARRGRIMIATRDLAPGDEIVRDVPVLVYRVGEKSSRAGAPPEDQNAYWRSAWEAFCALPAEKQEFILADFFSEGAFAAPSLRQLYSDRAAASSGARTTARAGQQVAAGGPSPDEGGGGGCGAPARRASVGKNGADAADGVRRASEVDQSSTTSTSPMTQEEARYQRLCRILRFNVNQSVVAEEQETHAGGHGHNVSALYPLTTKANHSCAPNCHWYTVFDEGGTRVRVMRALAVVAQGEEILVSYLDHEKELYKPRFLRRALLQKRKEFLCECSRCGLLGGAGGNLGDDCRAGVATVAELVYDVDVETGAAQLEALHLPRFTAAEFLLHERTTEFERLGRGVTVPAILKLLGVRGELLRLYGENNRIPLPEEHYLMHALTALEIQAHLALAGSYFGARNFRKARESELAALDALLRYCGNMEKVLEGRSCFASARGGAVRFSPAVGIAYEELLEQLDEVFPANEQTKEDGGSTKSSGVETKWRIEREVLVEKLKKNYSVCFGEEHFYRKALRVKLKHDFVFWRDHYDGEV
eukprot:g12378.t1